MAQTMHKCSICGGRVLPTRDDIVLKFPKRCVAIEDAAVGECQSCGESYLPAETSKRIDVRIQEAQRSRQLTKADRAKMRILSLSDVVTTGGTEIEKLIGAVEALDTKVSELASR